MTAADIHGPWVDSEPMTALVERVRDLWTVPITDLSDFALGMFLRQRIAVEPTLAEARRRLASGMSDDTELFEGQLAEAVAGVYGRSQEPCDPEGP